MRFLGPDDRYSQRKLTAEELFARQQQRNKQRKTSQMEEEDARRKTTKAGLQKYTASKLGGLTTVWVGGLHGQMEEVGLVKTVFLSHVYI